jgi:uncharacterized protein (DUF58 family)
VGILGWTGFASALVLSIMFIVSAIPFILRRVRFEVHFEVQESSVIVGEKVPGTVKVTNIGKRTAFAQRLEIPMVDVTNSTTNYTVNSIAKTTAILNIPLLRAGHIHQDNFMLPTKKRAVYSVGPIISIKTDPVHIFRMNRALSHSSKLFVHPKTLPLPSNQLGMIKDLDGNPTDKITQSDISFHDIRDYAPGDPIKNINWKASAKLDKLQVRQFEESKRAKVVFALSTNERDYASDDEFELTISALASLGIRAATDNREIEVVTSGAVQEFERIKPDIEVHENHTSRGVLDTFSSVAKSSKDLGIEDVCSKIGEKLHDISLCVIGIGSARNLNDIRKAAFQLPKNVEIIVISSNPKSPPKMSVIGRITYIQLAVLEDLKQIVMKRVI